MVAVLVVMGRQPHFIRSRELVEITMRTREGRSLLRPTSAMTLSILGVLARCLALFDVQLHAFVFLSNHGHLIASVADAWHSSSFIRTLKRSTALAIQRHTGWTREVWEPRTRPIPILDNGASLGRFVYVLSNGVKEGLVDSPLDWPGATSARALVTGEPIVAPAWRPAPRHPGVEPAGVRVAPIEEPQTIELAPLPMWLAQSADERRRSMRGLVASVVEHGLEVRDGRPSLGVRAILDVDPFAPIDLVRTPPPIAHFTDPEVYRSYLAERAAFRNAFHVANGALTEKPPATTFPPGSFMPSLGYVAE